MDREYDIAIAGFQRLRAKYLRTSHDGRGFILYPAVTAELKQKSQRYAYQHDLQRLLVSAFRYHRNEIPDLTLETLERYLQVFYTLLDLDCPDFIRLFSQRGLDDGQLPIDMALLKAKIREDDVSDVADFYDLFYEKQFEWCPVFFDLGMARECDNQIIPAYRYEKIKPRRDGNVPQETSTTVWMAEVPEELVSEGLRQKLPGAETVDPDPEGLRREGRNPGKRWRLALKKFKVGTSNRENDPAYKKFEIEREMYRVLKERNGIIQYIGWISYVERESDGVTHDYCTIVLELADCDLYMAFRDQSPPIAPSEIKAFWERMLDVAKALVSIHDDLRANSILFNMWHGDVKPENILVVGNLYKLADPGEATLEVVTGSKITKANSTRGTCTYGAPEKAAHLEGLSVDALTQLTDVWSLGCVFSVAATFIAHDTQGIRQYDMVRRIAFEQANLPLSDVFHDGQEVLPVVKEWHTYIRGTIRGTDAFTTQILDMVDDHMLVPVSQRWPASSVCLCIEEIFRKQSHIPFDIPPMIVQILDRIEQEEEEALAQDSSELLRNDPMPRSTRSRRRNGSERDAQFQTKKELVRIHPTAQRSQPRHGMAGPGPSIGDLKAILRTRADTGSDGTIGPPGVPWTGHQQTQWRGAKSTSPPHHPPDEDPVTVFQLRGELEQMGKPRSLSAAKGKLSKLKFSFKGKSKSAEQKQKAMIDDPDDPLGPFLKGRDVVILVDNGSSMHRHWTQVTYCVDTLVWRALGYDDDGMEMYFTNPQTHANVIPSPSGGSDQSVQHFLEAMKIAHPAAPGQKHAVKTNIRNMLNQITTTYLKSMESNNAKNTTIVIMTDGAWEGMLEEYLVDNAVKEVLDNVKASWQQKSSNSLNVLELLHRDRPLTIQFVRFGHNRKGIERLRRLDDDLVKMGYPDLIDAEPADGDAYKMIRGSLSDEEDKKVSVVSTRDSILKSPASDHREESSFNLPSRTNTMYSDVSNSPFGSPTPSNDSRHEYTYYQDRADQISRPYRASQERPFSQNLLLQEQERTPAQFEGDFQQSHTHNSSSQARAYIPGGSQGGYNQPRGQEASTSTSSENSGHGRSRPGMGSLRRQQNSQHPSSSYQNSMHMGN